MSPFIAACVPTGMKVGVWMMPCGVVIVPARAYHSVASIEKENVEESIEKRQEIVAMSIGKNSENAKL